MATAQGPDGKEQPANGHWLIIGKYHGRLLDHLRLRQYAGCHNSTCARGRVRSRCVPHPSDFRARVADGHRDALRVNGSSPISVVHDQGPAS